METAAEARAPEAHTTSVGLGALWIKSQTLSARAAENPSEPCGNEAMTRVEWGWGMREMMHHCWQLMGRRLPACESQLTHATLTGTASNDDGTPDASDRSVDIESCHEAS